MLEKFNTHKKYITQGKQKKHRVIYMRSFCNNIKKQLLQRKQEYIADGKRQETVNSHDGKHPEGTLQTEKRYMTPFAFI